jgi:hypothetical protein
LRTDLAVAFTPFLLQASNFEVVCLRVKACRFDSKKRLFCKDLTPMRRQLQRFLRASLAQKGQHQGSLCNLLSAIERQWLARCFASWLAGWLAWSRTEEETCAMLIGASLRFAWLVQ